MTTLVFHSSASIAEVRNRIMSELGEQPILRLWPFGQPLKYFHGRVWDDGFRLYRIINYGNTYLPVACGLMESTATGTKVTVRLRMNPVAIAFNLIWTAGWLLFIANYFRGTMPEGELGLWFGLLMIGFCWVMAIPGSVAEDREYRKAFRQLLEANMPDASAVSADSQPSISS